MFVKYILALLTGVVFLITTSGLLIFKTHCSCTGNEQISLYVSPETCEAEYHKKHACHSNECDTHHENHESHYHEVHDCETCDKHTHDCGCDSPDVKFLKLKNQFNTEEVVLTKITSVKIVLPVLIQNETIIQEEDIELKEFYIDPPPKIVSTLDYLIEIQKLKIPLQA